MEDFDANAGGKCKGKGRGRGRGRKKDMAAEAVGEAAEGKKHDAGALGQGDGGDGDGNDLDDDGMIIMCWICKVEPRMSLRKRQCLACNKDWDCFHKDSLRKKEADYLKEFKRSSTEDQVRRMFFAWKKCRRSLGGGLLRGTKCLFPWVAVHRSWSIRKSMQEGTGGKMKCYTSFCKHYVEKKGWSMERADSHWLKRLADRSWRHGVDSEDCQNLVLKSRK